MENGQSVFFLSPHTPLRACEARAPRARKALTPRFTDFFTDFEKKTDCFAVYLYQWIFSLVTICVTGATEIKPFTTKG